MTSGGVSLALSRSRTRSHARPLLVLLISLVALPESDPFYQCVLTPYSPTNSPPSPPPSPHPCFLAATLAPRLAQAPLWRTRLAQAPLWRTTIPRRRTKGILSLGSFHSLSLMPTSFAQHLVRARTNTSMRMHSRMCALVVRA